MQSPRDDIKATSVTVADARWFAQGKPSGVTGKEYAVWYFGENYELSTAVLGRLPEGARWIETGPRLNDISRRAADTLINLDRAFEISDRDWWECRNLAERGPYTTTAVAELCRYLLFQEVLETPGNHIVVVEESDLANLLIQAAIRRDVPIRQAGIRQVTATLARVVSQATAAARFSCAVFRRVTQVCSLKIIRKANPVPLAKLARCDVLFAAWTRDGDFPEVTPRELAHSMGYLPKLLRERGLSVGYIALPLDELSGLSAINRNVTASLGAAILPDDTISIAAIFKAAIRTLSTKARPRSGFSILGHPVDDCLHMIMARERFDWRAVNACLWANIGFYLAKHGCRPKAVFHVYENQSWEKGLRQGLRKSLPSTQTVGCHQSPLSELYLSMLPAKSELSPGRWPDIVLTHGALGMRQLTAAGAPTARVHDAGLFRHGAFILPWVRKPPANKSRRILCATGPGYHECCELALKAAQAVAGQPNWVVTVNFHPITTTAFRNGVQSFVELHSVMGKNLTFSDAPIKPLLADVIDVVMYADTNAGFEGVSSGALALNVARDNGLSFDKLPDGLSARVRTVTEIRAAIENVDQIRLAEQYVTRAMADCFSHPDVGNIMATLGLAATNGQTETSMSKQR